MKVFLAGCEGLDFFDVCIRAGIKNCLISYYHVNKSPESTNKLLKYVSQVDELICDSGLFTLMFGAGKGGTHTLQSLTQYTVDYIKYAQSLNNPKITFVESDVHKLLGMPAVFELRKRFEDSGLKVLYTWHIEEGIDGLYKLADKYDYIALSVPELRVLFTGKKMRYQDGVKDLLNRIRTHCGTKMPKIHLLGNTIQETMETNLAYSCDSTSYKSGVRYGNCVVYKDKKLTQAHIRSTEFAQRVKNLSETDPEFVRYIESKSESKSTIFKAEMVSCLAYAQYQCFLDKNFKFIGGK